MFAQRIFIRPVTTCECFVDQEYCRGWGGVPRSQFSASEKRNLHGPKIIPVDDAELSVEFLTRPLLSTPLDLKVRKSAPARQRKKIDHAGCLDSREEVHAFHRLLKETGNLGTFTVPIHRQTDTQREKTLRIETQVLRYKLRKAPDQQQRTSQ